MSTRIRVSVNGTSSGATLKIGTEHNINSSDQLVEAAAGRLLSGEAASAVDVSTAKLYLDVRYIR